MLIAGLTGGLACGKSFVAEALRQLGCYVVEADELGHEVLLPEGEAYARVAREFGPAILNADGTIDRARLAKAVFSDPAALAKLNAIVHPAVHDRALRRFREIGDQDAGAVVIYVAAILVETDAWRDFSKLIVVDCSRETQVTRAVGRTHPALSEVEALADVEARLARQLPAEKKRAVADYVIDTNGAKEETLRQTKMVFEELRRLAS